MPRNRGKYKCARFIRINFKMLYEDVDFKKLSSDPRNIRYTLN